MHATDYIKALLGSAILMLASTAQGAINLNSPTTQWNAVTYTSGNQTDYVNDQQTGINEGDIVGTAPGVNPQQTAFYFQFDGIQIAVRLRMDGDSGSAGYTGALWVGFMLDNNGSVDLFMGVINKGPTSEVGFYSPGTGANVSPSTTSIDNKNPLYATPITASNYLWTPVTVGPSGNDPVPGGTNDVGNDGNIDRFASFALPFSNLQAAAAAEGFTVTPTSQFRFVVGSSEQPNSINQDLNGTNGNVNSSSTYSTLGATSPYVTAQGGVVPEPGSLGCILPAMGIFLLQRRRRKN